MAENTIEVFRTACSRLARARVQKRPAPSPIAHAVAVHLRSLPPDRARRETDAVLQDISEELRSTPEQGEPSRWIADPIGLRRICGAAVRRLIALPASTPSLRLLAEQTAEVLVAISRALNGLALLVADPARPVP